MDENDIVAPDAEFPSHLAASGDVAVSPDGRWVATGGGDGRVVIRALENPKKCQVVSRHDFQTGAVTSIAFSPDSRLLGACGADGTVVCWALDMQPEELPESYGDDVERIMSSNIGKFVERTREERRQDIIEEFGDEHEERDEAVAQLESEHPVNLVDPFLLLHSVVQCALRRPYHPEVDLGKSLLSVSENSVGPMIQLGETVTMLDLELPDQGDFIDKPDEPTFVEQLVEIVVRKEYEGAAADRERIRGKLHDIRMDLVKLIKANEEAPELEQVEKGEFVIDLDLRERLSKQGIELERFQVQAIHSEMLALDYIAARIKHQCIDSMVSGGRELRGFHACMVIQSYPVRSRTPEEERHVEVVLRLRRVEIEQNRMIDREMREQLAAQAEGMNGMDDGGAMMDNHGQRTRGAPGVPYGEMGGKGTAGGAGMIDDGGSVAGSGRALDAMAGFIGEGRLLTCGIDAEGYPIGTVEGSQRRVRLVGALPWARPGEKDAAEDAAAGTAAGGAAAAAGDEDDARVDKDGDEEGEDGESAGAVTMAHILGMGSRSIGALSKDNDAIAMFASMFQMLIDSDHDAAHMMDSDDIQMMREAQQSGILSGAPVHLGPTR